MSEEIGARGTIFIGVMSGLFIVVGGGLLLASGCFTVGTGVILMAAGCLTYV